MPVSEDEEFVRDGLRLNRHLMAGDGGAALRTITDIARKRRLCISERDLEEFSQEIRAITRRRSLQSV